MTYPTPESGHQVHLELLRLTRGVGGFRLAIADGIERLDSFGGFEKLGFPSVDAYARERLGRSGRWVGDARTLNRRLAAWPALKEAFLSGRLSASKVELLARHLTRFGPGDGLDEREVIAMAETMTVRELRVRLGNAEVAKAGDEPRRWVQLTRHVDRVDAVAFEGVICLLGALGETARSAAIEGLLAEGLTTLLNRTELAVDLVNRVGEPSPTDPVAGRSPDTDIGLTPDHAATLGTLDEPPYIDPTVTDLAIIDIELRALARDLMRRDLRMGELAILAEALRVPSTHGHRTTTADDYYRDVLGVAPSSMAARIALARRVERLPRLRSAIEDGAIGFETATLLARIARPSTEVAWLALADTLTTKLFREQVDAAELDARVNGMPLDALMPPTPTQVEDARELERRVMTIVFEGEIGCAEEGVSPMSVSEPEPGPMLGNVPLRLTLPEDLASFWCDLEVLHADAGYPCESFVAFLVRATLDTWRCHTRLPAYGDIYLRDRFRCQSPVCRSRNCTPHHIVFRSQGGGDHPSNLVALCDRCHLSLVHGGHLRVTGLAPDALLWDARAYRVAST